MKFSRGDTLVPKGKQFPDGAVMADGYDEAERLMAHPMGGGFQQYFPEASASGFRPMDEAERSRALFWRTRFALADSEETFSEWTNGTAWNGWEMPRFDKAEAERLIRWLGDKRARFDAARDAFVTMSQDGEEEVWVGETVMISDGSAVKLYPVGTGAWIWDEVETRSGSLGMRANDIVKYSKPVDDEEAKLRFVLLHDPEKGRADIQPICDYRIKPVETVGVEEIEPASGR
jgi:hypothetical protein